MTATDLFHNRILDRLQCRYTSILKKRSDYESDRKIKHKTENR